MERPISAQPFVDDDGQSILITCQNGLALYLFRCHVCDSASGIPRGHTLSTCALCHGGDAKVTEQDFVVAAHQHIFWFDIAVNQLLIMGILQGRSNLLYIRHNDTDRDWYTARMALAQGAIGRIFHNKKRSGAFDPKIQHTYNVRVYKVSNGAGFCAEILYIIFN